MIVGIPTLGLSPYLDQLLAEIRSAGHTPLTICNGTVEDWPRCPYGTWWMPGVGIYAVWNHMIRAARGGPVAILNDDVYVTGKSITYAERTLRLNPEFGLIGWNPDDLVDASAFRPAVGAYREGGITGCAFALDSSAGILLDERFGWWGGDDDLVYQFIARGFCPQRMMDQYVKHYPSTTANQRPQVLAAVEADRALLLDKWGRAW